MTDYRSEQVQRTLLTIEAMAGHEAAGIAPSELGKFLAQSPANVTRTLSNLELAGWVERHPADTRRWRLAKKPVQLANKVRDGLSRAQQQLAQDTHNYLIMS